MVLILGLYVIHESFEGSSIADMIPFGMLGQAVTVALLLIVAGVVARVVEKTKKVVSKTRCKICGTPVTSGAIYCRPHLRAMLEREDRKTHATRIR
jgi:hypothetical protein